MDMDLTSKKCAPCEGGTPPLSVKEVEDYLSGLKTGWQAVDNKKLIQNFKFKDFKEAMDFVSRVASLAEAENHHPDIHISYNKVKIELWTHAVDGLSENDFILASKIELIKTPS